ncbi:MAG: glycosyltransferase family 4 protein [Nitrospiraceae bacterium]
MKLGIDGRELQRGMRTGIGRYLREILRALDRHKWDCIVYGERSTALPQDLAHIPVKRLAAPWTSWWDQITLPASLRADEVTVFFSPYYKCPLRTTCPTVITIHDLLFIGYPGAHRPIHDRAMTRLAKLYADRATSIVADSEFSKQSIVDRLGVDAAKVTVVPVGLGPEFRPTPIQPDLLARYGITDRYVLTIGNFMPHKNLRRLVQAFARLSSGLRSRYHLVLAGRGSGAASLLKQEARTLQIEDRLWFPGPIHDEHLPMVYSGADLFVLPSLAEGFGLPALEAMACGTAVVVSNHTSLPEVVGTAGALCDPTDPGSLAATLERVLEDRSLREDLGRRGIERARRFTPDRTTGQVLHIIERAAKLAA